MPSLISSRPSGGTQTARRIELPDYTPPAFPLTSKAQHELSALLNRHSVENLSRKIGGALEILQENAAGINDDQFQKVQTLEAHKEKLSKLQNSDDSPERIESERVIVGKLEETVTAQQETVQRMTDDMEKNFRRMIDAQEYLSQTRETLKELSRAASNSSSQAPRTQPNSSARRANPTDASPSPSAPQGFTPTDPANTGLTQQSPAAPSQLDAFRTKLTAKKDRYDLFPQRKKYAQNNDYRTFRKLLHDAQHQDSDVPVPHENTWFPEENQGRGGAKPGETRGGGTADAEEEDDDDLAVAKESISTRCPLTLQEFVNPVTSRKCPHSFEEEAILGMIRASGRRVDVGGVVDVDGDEDGVAAATGARTQGGRGRGRTAAPSTAVGGTQERAVQCPVPGCEKVLTKGDLYEDRVLKRKIARLQRAMRREEEEESSSEEEEGRRGKKRRRDGRTVVEVESGDEDEVDGDEVTGTSRRRRLKSEGGEGRGREASGPL
ncbi:SUMO transferase-like protein [Elsinoe australis]|uniref:SUMO transferase-like protein n=1 Tax=Elsinoe australis TaxID=40998 RepID=A0A4U7ASG3_9PEZI|nr:SUMO transferase-like protein [Elsinoe australis]